MRSGDRKIGVWEGGHYGFSQRIEHKKQYISFVEHFLSQKRL